MMSAAKAPAGAVPKQALAAKTSTANVKPGTGLLIVGVEPGKLADLCAVSLGDLESRPCYDPLSHLINVASRDNVTHVWVAGKCCVDNKTLPNDRQNDLESAVALWQNSLEFRQRP